MEYKVDTTFSVNTRIDALLEKTLVGFVSFVPSACYIRILSVERSMQKQGIGSALLRHAEKYMKPNCSKIFVEVGSLSVGQSKPFEFYLKNGYVYESSYIMRTFFLQNINSMYKSI